MRKILLLIALCVSVFFMFPPPKAKAIDPITMAILAPVAISAAKQAAPYGLRWVAGASRGIMFIGSNFVDMARLPLGAIQATAGAPFGFLRSGFRNIVLGAVAPFKLVGNVLMLPVYGFSAMF